MSKEPNDLLERVLHHLKTTEESIGDIAEGSGVGYDTILRIKKGEHDPGYKKVKALGDYFDSKKVPEPKPVTKKKKPEARPNAR